MLVRRFAQCGNRWTLGGPLQRRYPYGPAGISVENQEYKSCTRPVEKTTKTDNVDVITCHVNSLSMQSNEYVRKN